MIEASRDAEVQSLTVNGSGCGFYSHSRRWSIYLNLYFHFFALVSRWSAELRSATQYAMPPKFGEKWGTECLNDRFPLPTLLCVCLRWCIRVYQVIRHTWNYHNIIELIQKLIICIKSINNIFRGQFLQKNRSNRNFMLKLFLNVEVL